MSKLTRRSLVTTAAALPALAVGSAVAIEAAPDPIFALVERLKEAWAVNDRACIATDEERDRFANKYGDVYPDAFSKELRASFAEKMPGEAFHKCHTRKHEQIDNCRGKFPNDVVETLHEELTLQTKSYEETVRPLEDMQEQAEKALDDAIDAVLRKQRQQAEHDSSGTA